MATMESRGAGGGGVLAFSAQPAKRRRGAAARIRSAVSRGATHLAMGTTRHWGTPLKVSQYSVGDPWTPV